MPSIGRRCHELRVTDKGHEWRIVYRVDKDAIVIGDVFGKTTRTTPRDVIERCQKRLEAYDRAARERKRG
jgi:phage-related protein